MLVQKHEEIARELEWQQQQLGDALEHSLDQVIDDDILRLIFTACHPVLTVEAPIALTLRPDLRSHHGGDRLRLPCTRQDDGTADLSCQEDPIGSPRPL